MKVRAPLLRRLSAVCWLLLQMAGTNAQAADDPNQSCLICHEDATLKDRVGRSLFVDQAQLDRSVHGRAGLSCVSCHADLESTTEFPHAEILAKVNCATCHDEAQKMFDGSVHNQARQGAAIVNCVSCHGAHDVADQSDVRSKTHPLNQPTTCGACHFNRVNGRKSQHFVDQFLDSTHGLALNQKGLRNSATCATCHGSHAIKGTTDPESPMARQQVPNTCGQCHTGILRDYLEGVHGQDFARGVRDVPVCTDCHGEHQILSSQDRRSQVYATHVALTCARCHDNEELIQRYQLPGRRLRTFAGSFHGIASAYGEATVANCASCHGFHNIRPSDDPQSLIHPARLPQTCGRCHAGAGDNFSQAKIHVLDPKAANYAAYIVKEVYFYLIVLLMGGFVVYIAADLKARLRHRKSQ